jgi:hypothetical protein
VSRVRIRRVLRIVVPVCTVATVGVLARADAPPDQYLNFDQADTAITDAKTGLHWQRTVEITNTSFANAVTYCSGLSLDTFASGWRLPSYKELLTLVDESPHDEYTDGPQQIAIDGNAFPGTPVAHNPFYWTSSVSPSGSVFLVDFSKGTSTLEALATSPQANVRCVHNNM